MRLAQRTLGKTGFHDLTGGVYKARERIQGVVADTPLLAIPASWSRVADIQSELGPAFWDPLNLSVWLPSVPAIVARVQPQM